MLLPTATTEFLEGVIFNVLPVVVAVLFFFWQSFDRYHVRHPLSLLHWLGYRRISHPNLQLFWNNPTTENPDVRFVFYCFPIAIIFHVTLIMLIPLLSIPILCFIIAWLSFPVKMLPVEMRLALEQPHFDPQRLPIAVSFSACVCRIAVGRLWKNFQKLLEKFFS